MLKMNELGIKRAIKSAQMNYCVDSVCLCSSPLSVTDNAERICKWKQLNYVFFPLVYILFSVPFDLQYRDLYLRKYLHLLCFLLKYLLHDSTCWEGTYLVHCISNTFATFCSFCAHFGWIKSERWQPYRRSSVWFIYTNNQGHLLL